MRPLRKVRSCGISRYRMFNDSMDMKKILIACSLVMLVACAKETSEQQGKAEAVVEGDPTSEFVQQGSVAVKLTPEAARLVEAAKTRSGAVTRSGIGGIDEVIDRIGA